MPIDRRLLLNLDWPMLGATFALCAVGVATVLSATHNGRLAGLEMKQVAFISVGLLAMMVMMVIDYRRLCDRAPLFYVMAVAVLTYIVLFGPRIANTRRWFLVGPIQIQPSEFVKLVVALLVAKIFAEMKKESLDLADLLGPGAAVGVLVLLIARQPDLGTAVCLLPILFVGAFLAGLRTRAIVTLAIAGVLLGGLGWQFALKEYQKKRIETFLDPSRDPRGAGYQKIQSEIAVGSGGLTGKGWKQGSQAQLGYLPARHRSGHPGFVPYEAFETADGPLLICCGNDRLFAKLAADMGRPDWLRDERFATNRAKMKTEAGPPPGVTVEMVVRCICALIIIGRGTE